MKTKTIICLLITVFVLGAIMTQSGCKTEDNDSPSEEKKKYAWATGGIDSTGYGTILFTSDAGETWVRQGIDNPAFEGVSFVDIWAIDENNVWVTGSNNTLLKTTNGGLNWVKVISPAQLPDANLAAIYIDKQTNIWICGATGNHGIIYKSTDGGNNFSLLDTTFFKDIRLQGIGVTGTDAVYVTGGQNDRGETGFIAHSTDYGDTWNTNVPDNNFNKYGWIGVASSANTIVIYGGKGTYIVSADGGTSWDNDSIPVGGVNGADINHLIMLDDQTWWAACDNGNVWITINGGVKWTHQKNIPGNVSGSFLVGLDSWDRDLALIVASGFYYPPDGPIIKTTNGGESWETVFVCDVPLWKVTFIRD